MSEDTIASLRQQRGRIKGTLTRTKTFVDELTRETSIEIISARLEKVEESWSEFIKVEDQLLLHADQTSEIEWFETKYFEVKALLRSALNSRGQNVPARPQPTLSSTVFNTTANNTQAYPFNSNEVKLPRLSIPPFTGDFKDWPSFKDLFDSTIHNNSSLTNCQRLQYLKGLLKGEASTLVKHLTITDANYIEVWDKLDKRFSKKKRVVSLLIKTFIDQPSGSQVSGKHLRQIYDTSDEVVRGLKALGTEAELRDPWLIHIILNKVDSETKSLWSRESTDNENPSFEDFMKFLNTRCDSIDICNVSNKGSSGYTRTQGAVKSFHTTESNTKCIYCDQSHTVYACPQFKRASINGRQAFAAEKSLCFNCLRAGHSASSCSSKRTCQYCQRRHHSLLHNNRQYLAKSDTKSERAEFSNSAQMGEKFLGTSQKLQSTDPPPQSTLSLHQSTLSSINPTVQSNAVNGTNELYKPYVRSILLPTAVIMIQDQFGQLQACRALLDTGSQVSLISESCIRRLQLSRNNARISINGIGTTGSSPTRGKVELTISSCLDHSNVLHVHAYVIDKLTRPLPNHEFPSDYWEYIRFISLADPAFNKPSRIDLILGADVFFKILCADRIIGPSGHPIAQRTIFGWILSGEIPEPTDSIPSTLSLHMTLNLDHVLKKFWEIDDIPPSASHTLSEDERACEEHYKSTHKRNSSGRYVVQLPFNANQSTLGSSEHNAVKRLKSMERRLGSNDELKRKYVEFMKDYESLGHMEAIRACDVKTTKPTVYLPHHAVFKTVNGDSKLRVVFDGSSKTSTGVSLNDTLLVGPTVQRDLVTILLSFRQYKVAFSADVEKMYRQVKVSSLHTDFQRIVWRDDSTFPIKHFRLTTVTYGTSSAPFLATRTLFQIADDYKKKFPRESEIIKNQFYVDDLLSGADSIVEGLQIQRNLIKILSQAGFNLTKWRSNSAELIQDQTLSSSKPLQLLNTESYIKILGLRWDFKEDVFSFDVSMPAVNILTKRTFLSQASRVFDPLGFLAPTTVLSKILFQRLWLSRHDWDDPLSDDIVMQWERIRTDLLSLTSLKIPRWLSITQTSFQAHGFCDASESAYSAVIYCRSSNGNDQYTTTILAAKTKVAPIKQVSLPRLELCGALLLARLFKGVKMALNIEDENMFAWTDSTIVLAWLSDCPRRWKTFIANRTAEILDTIPVRSWNHIASKENPADCATRGLLPSELCDFPLWWNGPPWLSQHMTNWPTTNFKHDQNTVNKERRKEKLSLNAIQLGNDTLAEILEHHSSWFKIIRIVAICLRFGSNVKQPFINRNFRSLSTNELDYAASVLVRWVQGLTFSQEIHDLAHQRPISNKSKLLPLNAFLDQNGVLRVGGRLKNSKLSYTTKHPAILPKEHLLSNRIVEDTHRRYLHCGPTLLINILRQKYWILQARSIARSCINRCLPCYRQRAKTCDQLMGNLPAHRVIPSRPFLRCGVDYAGPFSIYPKRTRGARPMKGYICLFVCFCTKALHLELATDLTTDAFLAAFRRFISRRGIPSDLYSDNATNFIGAKSQLSELHKLFSSKIHSNTVSNFLSQVGVNWHLIPPTAPNFGGLWEAGVKATKMHIKRVVGSSILSYEEMHTLLAQIEAVLNSRPLCPLSEDINDLSVLTPGHFLIGEPLTAIPEPTYEDIKLSPLAHWHHIQKMVQSFWKQWHRDYLNQLQQRPKWLHRQPDLKIGDIVLIRDDKLPPTKWALGRIIETHPGQDNITRVVTLNTENGKFKRPVNKLCLLPMIH